MATPSWRARESDTQARSPEHNESMDRGWRRSLPAGRIQLLNVHWHDLRGGPSPRVCPTCDANVSAGDEAVHRGGELYHPDCATEPRWFPDAAVGVARNPEAWHNNHHAFPTSARHGLGRWQLDPSAWLITALERCHLAWDVVRIAPERQQAKLAAGHARKTALR